MTSGLTPPSTQPPGTKSYLSVHAVLQPHDSLIPTALAFLSSLKAVPLPKDTGLSNSLQTCHPSYEHSSSSKHLLMSLLHICRTEQIRTGLPRKYLPACLLCAKRHTWQWGERAQETQVGSVQVKLKLAKPPTSPPDPNVSLLFLSESLELAGESDASQNLGTHLVPNGTVSRLEHSCQQSLKPTRHGITLNSIIQNPLKRTLERVFDKDIF